MKIEIKNTGDLMDFINSDTVTLQQSLKVVSSALNVLIVTDFTKDQLINETEKHISKYLQDHKQDAPIFLGLDISVI
jgi:hypothetical protein